jgi:hypothetical protein
MEGREATADSQRHPPTLNIRPMEWRLGRIAMLELMRRRILTGGMKLIGSAGPAGQ